MMRKRFFLYALSGLALMGCASTDDVNYGEQSAAIGFDGRLSYPSRAIDDAKPGDLDNTTLDNVYVYGYYTPANQSATYVQVFGGTELTKNNNGDWVYDNVRYWVPGAKYYFYAYSCADIALNNTFGTPTMDLLNDKDRALKFTGYICDKDHNHDLIYAYNEGITGKAPKDGVNEVINFEFKHILTKINAVFESAFEADYDVKISNVVVENIRNQGNYNPKNNDEYKWENVVRKTTNAYVNLSVPNNANLANKGKGTAADPAVTVTTGTAYVLPYNYHDGDVHLNFSIEVIDKKSKEIVMTRNLTGTWSPNWKSGYSYTYRIKISGTAANLEEIKFGSMNVNGWTGDNDSSTDRDITFSAN